MFISYEWLKDYTDTKLSPAELRDRLTMVGLAIDAVETHNSDYVLDVEVPSNRPDCLSHLGIAREVTVIERKQLLPPPQIASFKTEGRAADLTSVEIKDTDLCPRYAARLVRGVKIAPSPDWLVKRLETIGQRPINNVADITNYVLHELGQPLHAFDFHKLAGPRIVVRRAAAGEKLTTLDGGQRTLTNDMLVIADAERPVALAGIMGGEDSEISESTTDVLIESAYFDPNSVRRTARQLGMDTEASRRFERGADIEGVLRAQERCVQLICEVAGGVASEDWIDNYPRQFEPRTIYLRPPRVQELTSLSVPGAEVARILIGLQFKVSEAGERLLCTVPSWRIDVEQEEDLVEEVARHSGFENIADELPPSSAPGEYQPSEMKQRLLRRALNAFGFDEAINFSFIERETQFEPIPSLAKGEVEQPLLKNPIIEEAAFMRATLLPGLLNSLRHNLNHGIRDVRLFEIGRVFAMTAAGELPNERLALAIVATGGANEANKAQAERELDFFDVKGALETAVDWMSLSPLSFTQTSAPHLRAGQSARIKRNDGTEIGTIGRLAENVAVNYKFRYPVFVLELDLEALLSGPARVVQYAPLPRYPSVVRDISLLLERSISLDEVLNVVRDRQVADFRSVRLVGIFEGGNIPSSKRSVTLRLEYRSDERTLRDEEVEERHAQLTSSLLETFAAEQR